MEFCYLTLKACLPPPAPQVHDSSCMVLEPSPVPVEPGSLPRLGNATELSPLLVQPIAKLRTGPRDTQAAKCPPPLGLAEIESHQWRQKHNTFCPPPLPGSWSLSPASWVHSLTSCSCEGFASKHTCKPCTHTVWGKHRCYHQQPAPGTEAVTPLQLPAQSPSLVSLTTPTPGAGGWRPLLLQELAMVPAAVITGQGTHKPGLSAAAGTKFLSHGADTKPLVAMTHMHFLIIRCCTGKGPWQERYPFKSRHILSFYPPLQI